jgi:hypothetical protein
MGYVRLKTNLAQVTQTDREEPRRRGSHIEGRITGRRKARDVGLVRRSATDLRSRVRRVLIVRCGHPSAVELKWEF